MRRLHLLMLIGSAIAVAMGVSCSGSSSETSMSAGTSTGTSASSAGTSTSAQAGSGGGGEASSTSGATGTGGGASGGGGSGGSAPSCAALQADWLKVTDYGAKGDGINDDRPAIQAALDAAKAKGNATVYFDAGTYLLGSSSSPGLQLGETSFGAPFTMNLIGKGATLLTKDTPGVGDAPASGTAMLHAVGYWQSSTICGLTFESQHTATHASTNALFLEGTDGNAIKAITITLSTFKNFSTAISVTGASGVVVDDNDFIMENGRDSGSGDDGGALPTVAIWLHDNSGNDGFTQNTTIIDNRYNGCGALSDLSGTVSKSCGDGFVFGASVGTLVKSNSIRGFSAEAILIQKEHTAGPPVTVSGNMIDGTMIPGDMYGGGLWGVRADASSTIVDHNIIKNAVTGIFACSAKFCGSDDQPATGLAITNNQITTMSSGTQEVYAGIQVLGISSSILSGNTVTFTSGKVKAAEAYGIDVSSASLNGGGVSVQTLDNTLIDSLPSHGGELAGIFLEELTSYSVTGNKITGFQYGFDCNKQNGTMSDLAMLLAANTLSGNGQNDRLQNGSFGQ